MITLPEGWHNDAAKLAICVAIIVLALWAWSAIKTAIEKTESDGMIAITLCKNILRVLIFGWAIYVVSNAFFGVNLAGVLEGMGIIGIAASLGAQQTISNVICGVIISLSPKLNVGDWVSIGGQDEVRLIDIDWHSTIVEDEFGLQQVIPNSVVASNALDMRPNYRTLVFPFELKHQVENITAFIDDCNHWLFAALRDIGADYEGMRPVLLLKSVSFRSIEVEALLYTNRQVSAYDIECYIYPLFLDYLRQREVLVE